MRACCRHCSRQATKCKRLEGWSCSDGPCKAHRVLLAEPRPGDGQARWRVLSSDRGSAPGVLQEPCRGLSLKVGTGKAALGFWDAALSPAAQLTLHNEESWLTSAPSGDKAKVKLQPNPETEKPVVWRSTGISPQGEETGRAVRVLFAVVSGLPGCVLQLVTQASQ